MPEGESWLAALVGWFCEVVCPATIVIRFPFWKSASQRSLPIVPSSLLRPFVLLTILIRRDSQNIRI